MKHIKTFENINQSLKIGMMYKHLNTPICYIGHNNDQAYPLLALTFYDNIYIKKYQFIEWVEWMENEDELKPLNITIEDYIIKNNIIEKTLDAFKKPSFSSGGCKQSLEKIKRFKEKLENNEMINIALTSNKYNL